jgi:uncharacterized protein (TIGR03067 family)
MQAFIASTLFGLALGLTAAADPQKPDPPPVPEEKTGATALNGAYTIVAGERDGKAIPEAEIKGAVVRFARGKVIGTDKNRTEFFAATYKLDTTKKPWKIDMKSIAPMAPTVSGNTPKDGLTSTGLVKKDGDTLTLIYALPGGETPKEFKTKAKQQMFVLKSFAAEPVDPKKFEKGP